MCVQCGERERERERMVIERLLDFVHFVHLAFQSGSATCSSRESFRHCFRGEFVNELDKSTNRRCMSIDYLLVLRFCCCGNIGVMLDIMSRWSSNFYLSFSPLSLSLFTILHPKTFCFFLSQFFPFIYYYP